MRTMHRTFGTLTVLLTVVAVHASGAAAARWQPWTDASSAVNVPTLGELEVEQDAVSGAANAGASASSVREVEVTFRATVPQHVGITVVSASGALVRTVLDRDVEAGPVAVAWDGRRDDGTLAADGTYELVVEAEHAGVSSSVSDTVRVDSTAPTVTAANARVRLTSRAPTAIRVPVRMSEAALLRISVGGASGRAQVVSSRPKGSSTVVLPVSTRAVLRRALARGSARVNLRITALDTAGNARTSGVGLVLEPPAAPVADPVSDGGSSGGGAADTGSLAWPVFGTVTSGFGQRWGRMHNGLDIAAPTGRPITAARAGTVSYSGTMSGYGNVVIVDHGTIDTLYAHQSRRAVKVGDYLRRGQVLGYVGSTGNSTGPHLHFEVRVAGTPKDPKRWLS